MEADAAIAPRLEFHEHRTLVEGTGMSLPTVASLSSALGTHLSPVEGFTARDVPIAAVHISELVDPNAYLSGGELLLTTGLALPTSDLGCRRYVARLVDAQVSALALGLGPVHAAPPTNLVEACRAADLTLLTVPAPTPFLVISRAYWTARSRVKEQQLSDAVAAHRALVDAAVAPDPPAAILQRLARLLDGWAVLLDADGIIEQVFPASVAGQVVSLDAEVSRLQVAGVHSSAAFTLGEFVVVVFPLAVQNKIVGYLAAGSRSQLDPSQRRVVLTATALLSLDVVRQQRTESAHGVMRRAVALLIDAGKVDAARMLAIEETVPMPRSEGAIFVARGRDSDDLVRQVTRWCPEALAVVMDRTTCWFVLPDGHGNLSDLERRLLNADPTVAASASELVLMEHLGRTRARVLQTVASLQPGIVILPRPDDVPGLHEAIARFLEGASAEVRDSLVEYLRHRGHWEHASKALGLHRNTVRYRVGRAREMLGVDLDDPDTAAQTWLALRATGVA